jgi:hypothetical protein
MTIGSVKAKSTFFKWAKKMDSRRRSRAGGVNLAIFSSEGRGGRAGGVPYTDYGSPVRR